MDNKKKQKQGKILLLLSNRSKEKKEEIAKSLDIHPSHLSKIFNSEILTSKVRRKAATYFDVDEAIFYSEPSDDLLKYQDEVNEPRVEYQAAGNRVEEMTAGQILKYLEDKDRRFDVERERYFHERSRLLAIIENLTKK